MQKNSKTWFLGVLSLLILTVSVVVPFIGEAREHSRMPSPEAMMCRMEARLALTPEQKEKLLPIVKLEMDKRRALVEKHRQEMSRQRAEFRESMEKERAKMEEKFVTVLTAEQMKELGKMADERRERWKQKGERSGHRGPEKCW